MDKSCDLEDLQVYCKYILSSPSIHVSYQQLTTIGGDIAIIIKKSENAKLITSILLGVLRLGVTANMYTTIKLPHQPTVPTRSIIIPRILCQSGHNGGNWYLQKKC